MLTVKSAAVVLVATMACSVIGGATANARSGLRLECDAEGAGDISMSARYEERQRPNRTRIKFSAEFEAAPNGQFHSGQRMIVFVDSVQVGTDTLRKAVGGDVVGDLNLSNNAGPGDNEKPLPANFPKVERGSSVVLRIGGQTVLGCRVN